MCSYNAKTSALGVMAPSHEPPTTAYKAVTGCIIPRISLIHLTEPASPQRL